MGKTRDLFKEIRDTKGTFHVKMGSIKDRNSSHQQAKEVSSLNRCRESTSRNSTCINNEKSQQTSRKDLCQIDKEHLKTPIANIKVRSCMFLLNIRNKAFLLNVILEFLANAIKLKKEIQGTQIDKK